ncbi:unnamed protein product [Prorocentrum cordatum]|uniref:Subtilisin n=1 Tax=Prorocentrum cordatum TaxID=2364126 RepID=A0ABN9UM30_9DINO|nr:unnamed protein product [Polarella glacialis]
MGGRPRGVCEAGARRVRRPVRCLRKAQTDMKAADLKNSIVYGDSGQWYTFNQTAKEEDAPDQWFVGGIIIVESLRGVRESGGTAIVAFGSDHEMEPPRRPGQIQKPISHVHRDLPRAPGSPALLPVV